MLVMLPLMDRLGAGRTLNSSGPTTSSTETVFFPLNSLNIIKNDIRNGVSGWLDAKLLCHVPSDVQLVLLYLMTRPSPAPTASLGYRPSDVVLSGSCFSSFLPHGLFFAGKFSIRYGVGLSQQSSAQASPQWRPLASGLTA